MKSNPLDHAKHNENVCEYLDTAKDKHDWVVTTAFYSALHYVRHKIFPYTLVVGPNKTKKFDNFDDYYDHQYGLSRAINKHQALQILVRKTINSTVAESYESLLAMSQGARYENYNLDKKFSTAAKTELEIIKANCNKPKS